MMRRLREMPRYSIADSTIEASHYNQIRLALQRLPTPIRLRLDGLNHVDLIIDGDSWVCVDTTLNDLPIVAWTDFDSRRQGLHHPINCKLHYFHYKAGLLVLKALNAARAQLAEQTSPAPFCPLAPTAGKPRNQRHLHSVY